MSTFSGRRIVLWVERRGGAPAVNPVMEALLERLAAEGATTSVRVPESEVIDLSVPPAHERPDLVLLKSATTLALSLAVADEQAGGRFLNPARATLRAQDKAAALARLAAAGLPVPETLLWGGTSELPPSPGAVGGWVSKPVLGVHGHGVVFHERFPTAADPPSPPLPPDGYVLDDGTRLLQRCAGGDEADVKVYVAGDRCFAGTKRFSAVSYASDAIEPRDLSRAETEVVRGVGEALNLRCFGVDLRYDEGRPVVIDANSFPGYRGFPEAMPALLHEVQEALEAGR